MLNRLNAPTLEQYQRAVMKATTRAELDFLARAIAEWHDPSANANELEQLRKAIEAKRDILARNDPQ